MNNHTFIKNKIMDLRDNRIRLQRQIVTLEDLEFWAPWSFTNEQIEQLEQLKLEVQCIKLQEKTLREEMYRCLND